MSLRLATFNLLLLLVLCFSASPRANCQNFGGRATIKPIKGFKIAEPYDSPNETQIKSRIEGGQALPEPGGRTILSQGVILRTFTRTNTPELIVKCQECVLNSATREVNSSGPIQMQTADGRFTIEGIGFFFQQTNSSLIISNQVHTLIQSASFPLGANQTNTSTGPESGPLFIDSGQFSYNGSSGRGIWWDHVCVTGTNAQGTNLVLRSEVLSGTVPADPG